MKTFSIEEAIVYGWKTFLTRPWFFAGVTVFTVVLSGISNVLKDSKVMDHAPLILSIISILASIANFLISIGTQKLYLKIESGEKPEFSEIFAHASMWWSVLLGGILYGLIVVGGLLLLIIPGVIFAVVYGFQYVLIVDKGMKPIEALKESARITKGARFHLFLFAIVLGILNVIGAMFLVMGLFVSIPLTNLAIVHVYRKLLAETDVPVQQALPVSTPA